MSKNPLLELKMAGQSVWIDYLGRDLLRSGELMRLVAKDGIRGAASNPAVFQKAIEGSSLYDPQLRNMFAGGMTDPKELFLGLASEDVSEAADVLMPLYKATGGRDGYVSMEVSPDLSYGTDASAAEAKRLFETLARNNVMVKVPGTEPGLQAIERLAFEGVNVNVTLLFSVSRYEAAAGAYMDGLERRVRAGLPLSGVTSVASFFVSRVDAFVDDLLDEMLMKAGSDTEREAIRGLRGKAAAAGAKLAYRKFREMASGPRFQTLKDRGARLQRPLWGSTGTKDPAYSDVKYVEELIGPETVNMMSEETMVKFKDHGMVRVTIDEGLEEAEAVFQELKFLGIDMEAAADRLEKDGVLKSSESFFDLLDKIAEKTGLFITRKAA